ncbi:pyrroline-5-carboxylate reductase [Methylobacterium crusticola]|uniref:pyrroline-5-carboxylate reductase n=1 Tax=Methylobacterium crusticola TaxID=1697972 RepID=UPI001396CE31|nr:pyrroline-5-carboxylate reductase [Methylobacterium crusticola]
MTADYDVAVIGCGNMGAALISGYLARSPESHVLVVDPDRERSRSRLPAAAGLMFSERLTPLRDRRAAVTILAVKPQSCAALLPELAGTTAASELVLSIVAGVGAGTLQQALPGARIVRCMPNTPAVQGAGAAVLWSAPEVPAIDRSRCQALLQAVGSVDWVPDERHIDLATAVSGSGPAYFFAFTEALGRAGEIIGLAPELAAKLARATAIGAAAMLDGQAESPGQLKAAVRSPAGTTDAALRVFEQDAALDALVQEAVSAAHRRAIELSQTIA